MRMFHKYKLLKTNLKMFTKYCACACVCVWGCKHMLGTFEDTSEKSYNMNTTNNNNNYLLISNHYVIDFHWFFEI